MDSAGADSREATNINKSDIALTYFRMLVNKFSLTLAMEAARLMFSQSTQTQQHREHGWRGSVSNLGCLMEFSLRLPKLMRQKRKPNEKLNEKSAAGFLSNVGLGAGINHRSLIIHGGFDGGVDGARKAHNCASKTS